MLLFEYQPSIDHEGFLALLPNFIIHRASLLLCFDLLLKCETFSEKFHCSFQKSEPEAPGDGIASIFFCIHI